MNDEKNKTQSKEPEAKNGGSGTIGERGNGRKDGKATGHEKTKGTNRTFQNARGENVRRRNFRKAQRQENLAAKKGERKKEILAAAAALADTAKLL
jgi:hypothetical protein